MNRLPLVLVPLLAVILTGCGKDDNPAGPSGGRTIHVPSEEPTIQAGIDAALPGDTVLVAGGTYYEHDIWMKSGVYLTSETGQADCVTVDAQGEGRVFGISDADSTTSIVGFTITGGGAVLGPLPSGAGMTCWNSSLEVTACAFVNNEARLAGGLLCFDGSSPVLTDCTFEGNQADENGGALYCNESSPTLTNCKFEGKQSDGCGGAVYCNESSPTFTNCTFEGNQDTYVSRGGGAMACWESSPTLTNCTFVENGADSRGFGAGLACLVSSSPVLVGCTFSENNGSAMSCDLYSYPTLVDCVFSANDGSGMFCGFDCSASLTGCTFSGNHGAAMYCLSASPTLTGCTLSGNQAAEGGAFVCAEDSTPTLAHCIIAFSQSGGAVYCEHEESQPLLECCDLYGNAGGDWVGCIADQYGVDGNFSADPLFCDAPTGDFTLASNSPCLPGGNDCGELIGAHGQGCEESLVKASSWGSIKAMHR